MDIIKKHPPIPLSPPYLSLTVASFVSLLVSVNMCYHALKYGNACTLTAGILTSSRKLTEGL